jgi:two-component system, chemotaxis family, CheB/CheR fusion protein
MVSSGDIEQAPARAPQGTKPAIVGIGASAGGIHALQDFFKALPDDLGAAYVVVMHLDPEHQSDLASILGGRTKMAVSQIEGSVDLKPDHVYVVPPNRRLHITDHEISAVEFDEPRGRRVPIDFFFRSLAEQHGDGFAVILSGAGSDGAIGVKAVKEAGGIILVQDPNEAEYPSMPHSAIATGVADFVLPVRELALRLGELVQNKENAWSLRIHDFDEDMLRRVLAHLRVRTGHDFSQYKRSTVLRRIARRMQVTRSENLTGYCDFLRDNREESQSLLTDLLISVTTFFRDSESFEILAAQAIPKLFEGKEANDTIRVWVPACATGEEAYAVAILLLEEVSRREIRPQIQVLASDLDSGALAIAREGRYPVAIEADVSEDRLNRYFSREGEHYCVKRELRDMVLFAAHSVLKDPPFSRIDLISCRNLLIYLDRRLQQQVCSTFHYALNAGGFLFLGMFETADDPPGLFRTFDRKARIHQSTAHAGDKPRLIPKLLGSPRMLDEHIPQSGRKMPPLTQGNEAALHRQVLETVAPPSMLVDELNRVVHLSDNAGRYLQPPGGPVTADATELVRPELRFALRSALHRAFQQREVTLTMPILVGFNGSPHRVYLQVRPVFRDDAPPRQSLVLFIEGEAVEQTITQAGAATGEPAGDATVRQLNEELQAAQSRMRTMQEEGDATNEELRAANEELQSVNEEYRSTHEELETSKEELQSINEELQTVNNELKVKLDQISRAHSDLQNLMAATDFATLFLDRTLRIRRFTQRTSDLFSITLSDEGRPITDFTHNLEYDGLARDARAVLDQLTSLDREIRSKDQRWYQMRMRPYRTVDNIIDGVVVTFVDVTELHGAEERFRLAAEAAPSGMIMSDGEGRIVLVNALAEKLFGYSREELFGQRVEMLVPERFRRQHPGLRNDYAAKPSARPMGAGRDLFALRKDGTEIPVEIGLSPITTNQTTMVLSAIVDISERKQAAERIASDLRAVKRLNQLGLRLVRKGSDLNECLNEILDLAIILVGTDKGNIQLFDPASRALSIAVHRGFEEPFLKFFSSVSDDISACGMAMQSAERVIVEDVAKSEIFAEKPSLNVLIDAGVRAVVSIPLISSGGNLLGMISTHFIRPHRPTEQELRLMDLLTRQAADYLERKRAEETEKTLVREIQHRSNNIFAVIDAIAHRTLSGDSTLDQARKAFGGRLQALARAHQQLTKSNWSGANLRDIVRLELEPFAARATARGDNNVIVSPQHTQNFSLVLHELAANAVKYGALSNSTGQVNISWKVTENGDNKVLKFQWREHGGPAVVGPKRQGFGTLLLKSIFPEIQLDFGRRGLSCEIDVPLANSKPGTIEQMKV